MQVIFETLMQEIDRSLSQKNREQFTKNVNQFRREITSHIKTPSPSLPPRAYSVQATSEMIASNVLSSLSY